MSEISGRSMRIGRRELLGALVAAVLINLIGALGVFALQMVLNVAWSPTFFTLQAPLAALGIILALWVLVVATIVAFDRVDRRAALLLVPYFTWVSFAAVLNYSLWRLN